MVLSCATAATGEMEFVMSMNTSNISPTFEIHPEQKLRIRARYDATVRHTGEHTYSVLFSANMASLRPCFPALWWSISQHCGGANCDTCSFQVRQMCIDLAGPVRTDRFTRLDSWCTPSVA